MATRRSRRRGRWYLRFEDVVSYAHDIDRPNQTHTEDLPLRARTEGQAVLEARVLWCKLRDKAWGLEPGERRFPQHRPDHPRYPELVYRINTYFSVR